MRLRRSLSVLAALALGTSAAPMAEAAKAKKATSRVITFEYVGLEGLDGEAGNVTAHTCFDGAPDPFLEQWHPCTRVALAKWETAIKVSAVDMTGVTVPLAVRRATPGAAPTIVCGAGSVPAVPSNTYTISALLQVPPSCVGLATRGTITITVTGMR